MRVLQALCGALVLAVWLTPDARADEWNKQTYLTFGAPVQVPGATLPAGTYMFKLADLQSNRHVVQIFDKEGKQVFATILAIPEQRLEPTDKPVVMFSETPAGTPPAVRAWFYPGNTIGDEFVYPKQQAMKIAQAAHQSVLSMSDESMRGADRDRTSSMKTAEVSRVGEGSQAANVEPSKPAATGTAGMSTEKEKPARHNARLPRTASPLTLYELMSGLALAGALGVRHLRKHIG